MTLFGVRIARVATIDREKQEMLDNHKWDTLCSAHRIFVAEGYQEWCDTPPPRNREFLLIRAGWYWPSLTSVAEVSPYMNTVGTFWKLP